MTRMKQFIAISAVVLMTLVLTSVEAGAGTLGSCHKGTAQSSRLITPPAHVSEKYLRTWYSPVTYTSAGKPWAFYLYEETVRIYSPPIAVGGRYLNGSWSKIKRTKWRNCTTTRYAV